MIYTNEATTLALDIAVRSVISLHQSDHVSDVICASVLPMQMYIEECTTNGNAHRSHVIVKNPIELKNPRK